MPKRTRRPDKCPNDGLNRTAVIFDGDNLRSTLIEYGYLPHFDDILDWIEDPNNLGVDRVSRACIFLTVPHPYALDHRVIPIKHRDRFCLHFTERVPGQPGYRDDEMYLEALSIASSVTTMVLVSSDGGAEGGTYRFAEELRAGRDRFRGVRRSELATEVICISSALSANADWERLAKNSVPLEEILPQLKPRLSLLRPFAAMPA